MSEAITITGKSQVVQDMYDFKFYIEQQWSNGEWKRNHAWPSFNTINDAHSYFQRAKKIKIAPPAALGDIDDV